MDGECKKVRTFTLDDLFEAWATDDEGKAHEILYLFNSYEQQRGEAPETMTVEYRDEGKYTFTDLKSDILYAIEEGKKKGLSDWRSLEFRLHDYEEKSKSLSWRRSAWEANDKIHDLAALIGAYNDLVTKLGAEENNNGICDPSEIQEKFRGIENDVPPNPQREETAFIKLIKDSGQIEEDVSENGKYNLLDKAEHFVSWYIYNNYEASESFSFLPGYMDKYLNHGCTIETLKRYVRTGKNIIPEQLPNEKTMENLRKNWLENK
jgi:hypothetical protein